MGFWLLLPFFLIRFGLLSLIDRKALNRAAYFPPRLKQEQIAYWIYQLSTGAMFISLFFLSIQITGSALFYTGIVLYAAGILLLIGSVIHFAKPSECGFNQAGLYRFSRNPMYVAYFLFFLGCSFLTESLLLLGFLLVFQLSAHWIIRSEERWCIGQFGETYQRYMKKVRRYF